MFKNAVIRYLLRPGFKGELVMTVGAATYVLGKPVISDGKGVFEARADINVRDEAFFRRLVFFGQTGFGIAYENGEFTTSDLRSLLKWFLQNRALLPGMNGNKSAFGLLNRGTKLLRLMHGLRKNTRSGSRRNIKAHYDLSNDFYALWLDPSMTYSSAVFTEETGRDLAAAQEEKYRRICEKLDLRPGDRVLEIGCGWGGFAEYAATHHDVRLTVTTISDAQYAYAKERFERKGIADRIELLKQDYRDLDGEYEKIASIEMMEALGHEHVRTFIGKCAELLVPGGKMCFQCITVPDAHFQAYLRTSDYIRDRIFPGSELLSMERVFEAGRAFGMRQAGVEDIRQSYAVTLRMWDERFQAKRKNVLDMGFDESFMRMWEYYLVACEVAFETGYIGVVQAVLVK